MLVFLIADVAEYVMNGPLTRQTLNDLVQAEPRLNPISAGTLLRVVREF